MSVPGRPTIEQQRRFWDWHWEHQEERKALNDWTAGRAEVLLDWLRSLHLDYPRILDLGCGPGWFTGQLAQLGEATGIDLSQQAIAVARSRFPEVTFIAGNLYEVPLPIAHFDVVVSQEVIGHVEDQVAYVHRAADVLKPRGYLLLSTANKFVLDRLGDVGWNKQPAAHIDRPLNLRGLERLLRPRFDLLWKTTVLPIGHKGILRLVNSYKLNAALSLLVPNRHLERLKEKAGWGYQLIVLAQKRS